MAAAANEIRPCEQGRKLGHPVERAGEIDNGGESAAGRENPGRHCRNERTGARHHGGFAGQDALRLEHDGRGAESDHAGQRPARTRHDALAGAGGGDDRLGLDEPTIAGAAHVEPECTTGRPHPGRGVILDPTACERATKRPPDRVVVAESAGVGDLKCCRHRAVHLPARRLAGIDQHGVHAYLGCGDRSRDAGRPRSDDRERGALAHRGAPRRTLSAARLLITALRGHVESVLDHRRAGRNRAPVHVHDALLAHPHVTERGAWSTAWTRTKRRDARREKRGRERLAHICLHRLAVDDDPRLGSAPDAVFESPRQMRIP